jgi:hypothetical protein
MVEPTEQENRPSRGPQVRERNLEYSKPQLDRLGRICDLTRMPGGSINIEGSSGKPHKQ